MSNGSSLVRRAPADTSVNHEQYVLESDNAYCGCGDLAPLTYAERIFYHKNIKFFNNFHFYI